MKIGIIIETKDYEKAWNAFRFARTACDQQHQVKVFLMGAGVECEGLTHDKYNVNEQLEAYLSAGGELLACGTCLQSRQMNATDTCPLSTMQDCLHMVEWADKILTF